MTLKRLAAKIAHKNEHLITLSDRESGKMTKMVLQKIRDNQFLCKLSVKP